MAKLFSIQDWRDRIKGDKAQPEAAGAAPAKQAVNQEKPAQSGAYTKEFENYGAE